VAKWQIEIYIKIYNCELYSKYVCQFATLPPRRHLSIYEILFSMTMTGSSLPPLARQMFLSTATAPSLPEKRFPWWQGGNVAKWQIAVPVLGFGGTTDDSLLCFTLPPATCCKGTPVRPSVPLARTRNYMHFHEIS